MLNRPDVHRLRVLLSSLDDAVLVVVNEILLPEILELPKRPGIAVMVLGFDNDIVGSAKLAVKAQRGVAQMRQGRFGAPLRHSSPTPCGPRTNGNRSIQTRPAPNSDVDTPVDWNLLTVAERRVARLVAEGLTNRQVAKHLFLSPHTVDSHLRHVFSKLGINSRIELAIKFVAAGQGRSK